MKVHARPRGPDRKIAADWCASTEPGKLRLFECGDDV